MSGQQPWQPPDTPPQGQPPPYGRQPYGQQPYAQQPYAQQQLGWAAYGAAPANPGPAPKQVRVAAILLLVQVLLGEISTVVFFPSSYQRALARQPAQPDVDPQLMQSVMTVVLAITIIISIIWLGVWVLFVVKAWQGRNWARMVLTVFIAISLVSVLALPVTIAQGTMSLGQLPFSVASVAIAVVALVLLWLQPAKGWYEANSVYKRATGQYPPRGA